MRQLKLSIVGDTARWAGITCEGNWGELNLQPGCGDGRDGHIKGEGLRQSRLRLEAGCQAQEDWLFMGWLSVVDVGLSLTQGPSGCSPNA